MSAIGKAFEDSSANGLLALSNQCLEKVGKARNPLR